MQGEAQAKYISPQDYLALERESEYKSEYYDGEIFGMSGASFRHNKIAINIVVALDGLLKGRDCNVFHADLRIKPKSLDYYTYPDISVICGKPEFDDDAVKDTVTNPIVLIEILSESTKNYDRGEKFEFYRTIESLKEYLLVDQSKVHAEHYRLLDNGEWVLREYRSSEGTVSLNSIDCVLDLKTIYENTELL